eukprot:SAG31_NODE_20_length_34168_cov_33.651296_16_plen_64_part_00
MKCSHRMPFVTSTAISMKQVKDAKTQIYFQYVLFLDTTKQSICIKWAMHLLRMLIAPTPLSRS